MSVAAISKQILVYDDYGVNGSSAEALVKQLTAIIDPQIKVLKCKAEDLKARDWESKTLLLIMGGGKCSDWDTKLDASTIERMALFVKGGGKFCGFCAGAYYASAKSTFNTIVKERPLALFKGQAIGPVFPHSEIVAQATKVTFFFGKQSQEGLVHYQGGPYFEIDVETEILAKYESGKAACIYTKGAILCAFHPEFAWTFEHAFSSDPTISTLGTKLVPQEEFRQKIWQEFIKILGLPTKVSALSKK